MQYFLAKTEPHEYSIDDLARAREDMWDGVTNFQAIGFIKQMKKGDRVLIYHSGKNPGIVGLAEVSQEAVPDKENAKSWVPRFAYISTFNTLVLLEEIKSAHLFDDWYLVRQGRLSTMPVPEKFITWLQKKGLTL